MLFKLFNARKTLNILNKRLAASDLEYSRSLKSENRPIMKRVKSNQFHRFSE